VPAWSVPVSIVAGLVDGPGRVGPQPMAQIGTLVLGHHHEIELNLLHAGHRDGSLVDPLGKFLGAGQGGHWQGTSICTRRRRVRTDRTRAELTERQADLEVLHRADCGLEL